MHQDQTQTFSPYLPFLKHRNIVIGYLISEGDSNAVIAEKLSLSESRVKQRVSEMLKQGGWDNRTELAVVCTRLMEKLDINKTASIAEWYWKI